MPINKKDYHPQWEIISKDIRARADGHCELCNAENGQTHWKTGSKVILTVHHINHDKQDNSGVNLIALCQRCHLRLDLGKHIANRRMKKGQGSLI
jgi:5-methylcytosine-specific restriction endonuclease McrA